MEIELRECVAGDWEVLQQFGRSIFYDTFALANKPENMEAYMAEAFHEKTVRSELANPDSRFWFACIGDAVAGYLKVNFGAAQTDLRNENAMEIQRIYVSTEYQGQGVAQALMAKAKTLAEATAVDFMWLGVWEHNPRAIRFYEKMGFAAFSTHSFFMGDEEQTDILMQLKL